MPTSKIEELQTAIAQWTKVAESEIDLAEHYERLGCPFGSTETYRVRADSYFRTAKSLRLELETGKPHCNCHMSADCPSKIKTGVLL